MDNNTTKTPHAIIAGVLARRPLPLPPPLTPEEAGAFVLRRWREALARLGR